VKKQFLRSKASISWVRSLAGMKEWLWLLAFITESYVIPNLSIVYGYSTKVNNSPK